MLSPDIPAKIDPQALSLRSADSIDLGSVAGWIRSRRECELWAGPGLAYPLEPDLLAVDIELYRADSLIMHAGRSRLAFGQLLEIGRHRCLIARLIVAPDRRRHGYGSRMVAELLQRARQRGYRSVSLNVDRDNATAQRLYLGFGFAFAPRPQGESASPVSLYMACGL